jgi:putative hydroxymethylpyrimidine transport system ATP-binding protein
MLHIHQLSYSFLGQKPLFQDISLEVRSGEFVSIIGPSGSGKSTLFKLISGLIEPNQGEIEINGNKTSSRLGKVGYMPQKDLLLPWRTVLDNVLLPIEVMNENKKQNISEARKWLSRFGLAEFEKAYPHELSGGMKQRIAFLRTILIGKDLLLLDEPFGALDSLTKRKMHIWLLSVWKELQKSVLFITHDLEEAILLSDRIYIIEGDSGMGIKEVKVNFPRPRHTEIIYQTDFMTMRKELEMLLHHES